MRQENKVKTIRLGSIQPGEHAEMYLWTESGNGCLRRVVYVRTSTMEVVTVGKTCPLSDWATRTASCHGGTPVYVFESREERDTFELDQQSELSDRRESYMADCRAAAGMAV